MARINRSFPISTQSSEALIDAPSLGDFTIDLAQIESSLAGQGVTTSAIVVTLPQLTTSFVGLVINPITGSLNVSIPPLQLTNFGGTAGALAGGGMLLGGCQSGDNG